jgi:hypothetical protein
VDSGAGARAIESGMTHITGHDHDQMLLLPEAIDDYIAAGERALDISRSI